MIIATLYREVHDGGWYIPPRFKYGLDLAISITEGGVTLVKNSIRPTVKYKQFRGNFLNKHSIKLCTRLKFDNVTMVHCLAMKTYLNGERYLDTVIC